MLLLESLPNNAALQTTIERVYDALGRIKVEGCAASEVYRNALWYAFQLREHNAIVEDGGFRYTREDAEYIEWPEDIRRLPKTAYTKEVPGRLSIYLNGMCKESVIELLQLHVEYRKGKSNVS